MGVADELITRGWTQNTTVDPETGSVCLYGAAVAAMGRIQWTAGEGWVEYYHPEYGKLAGEVLQRVAPVTCFTGWNDTPERTFDEVLRVAKEADEVFDAIKELAGEAGT